MEQTQSAIKILNAKELAAILGCSLAFAYQLLNAQGFPTIAIGGRKLVREDSFNEWLKQNEGQRVDLVARAGAEK